MPDGTPRALIVFFLGNGEDLQSGVRQASLWRDYDLASVVMEYPGYGDSEGSPGKAAILAAAEVTGRDAAARAAELGVPLFAGGASLGTFSAVHVASREEVAKVLLSAPPTTMVEAAGRHYPWLPVGLLLRHRFDNLSVVPQITAPSMILHGDRDSVVPQSMGRRLAEAMGGPCEFIDAKGEGHMLSLHAGGPFEEQIRRFLDG